MYESTVEEQLNDTGNVKSRLEKVASRCVVKVPMMNCRRPVVWRNSKAMFTRLKVCEAKFREEVAELHRKHGSELKLRRKNLSLKVRWKSCQGNERFQASTVLLCTYSLLSIVGKIRIFLNHPSYCFRDSFFVNVEVISYFAIAEPEFFQM